MRAGLPQGSTYLLIGFPEFKRGVFVTVLVLCFHWPERVEY